MKRLLMLMAVLMVVLMIVGTTTAALIGLEDQLGYPDIMFDNTGKINYTANNGSFVLDADDWKIVYADGSVDYLTGNGYMTDIKIYLTVDNNGNLVGTGTMVEKVIDTDGIPGNEYVTIKGERYYEGTTLLAGTVVAFGWGEGDNLGDFDFLIDNLSGALVKDGIWPTTWPTGIIAHAEKLHGWSGSWECDFTLDKVKGDKAPVVPIPPTILLLGSGLLGFILFNRRKQEKKGKYLIKPNLYIRAT